MVVKFSDLLFLVLVPFVFGARKKITIGGLFHEDDVSRRAFTASTQNVNAMRHTLTDELANIFFVADTPSLSDDTFEVSQTVCSLVHDGIAAIIGPHDKSASAHVQSMCDTMDMPNIITRWDSDSLRMKAVNLYPHATTLSQIFPDLVMEFKWKSFTIIYDNTDGLIRMNKLLERWDPKGYPVTLRHLGKGPNYRSILKKVKNSGEKNIVIDCAFDILEQVLLQSQQVGLLSERHKILVSSLDLQVLDLEPFQYSGANITGIRLVDPRDDDYQNRFSEIPYKMGIEDLSKMPLHAALVYDAVQLFARAFKQFEDAAEGHVKRLKCDGIDSWEYGSTLSNFMRSIEMRGLTGLIKFHTSGFRSDFRIDIVKLSEIGLHSIGTWNSTTGIEWKMESNDRVVGAEEDLANKTFTILIALLDPYNMLKESATMRTGNDRYEGFAIDIIQELSKMLHFNYTLVEQVDKEYGRPDDNGRWSGMLGKIMREEADLAITDLTITAEREKAVDFTMPFLNLGISILFRKPSKAPPSLFSFLSPFAADVWLNLIGAYIFSSLLLFLLGRMCPAEWNNPYPCIEEPTELENQFTIKNSFWFTIGSIMQQGSEIAPIGTSTRMLAIAWWFFSLIIANSYTANLAAFLVVETNVRPIKSAEDLANLNGYIKYGAKINGATYNFFKGSNHSTYAKMYHYMRDNENDVMMTDNDKGSERVEKEDGKYAFLMESSSIAYISQRQCNLTQIGDPLDSKGYGIAMRKGFIYRDKLNTAVLQMQESGLLAQLKDKWWKEKRGGGKCTAESSSSAPAELTLDNVGGVFLVLVVGIAVSFVLSVLEMLYDVVCTSLREKVPFKQEFTEELKFIMKFKGTVKPVRRRKSSSHSTRETSTRGSTPPYNIMPSVIMTTHGENDS
ncbi:glutamate receptor ionotropic, kainate 2 [Diachasma alloeum]|uniref:glutamate receptor ionotropic, kainate 2 n=1 Tax=Diachasma alloeum TaxID=454923 RepID=UPI0007382B17|nr:glutamate receptor ionotropic, kainate 2 [Diachasma alloeum]XP_028982391.1 glutamate receptor ionotropic, kainate 2 [Diachasma alloeum]